MRRGIRSCWCLALATVMVLVLAANTELRANTPPPKTIPESIERYLDHAIQQWKIPGLAVAIVKNDQIFYAQGFGQSDNQHSITPQTPFIIGSLSKSLTATAVMQMVEAGKIDLEAPVKKYLPWFRLDSAQSDRITISNLLHHTSGLSIQTDIDYLDLNTPANGHSLENYVRRLAQAKPAKPAGIEFSYANANYAILGMVVQQVAEIPYEKYIEAHIFQPLEMHHSFTSQYQALESSPPLATGYRFWLDRPVATEVPFDRQNLPAGYLISSAHDIANYLIMHLNQGRFQGKMLISPASWKKLHEPAVLAWGSSTYAMGWVHDQVNNDLTIQYHGGELVNFSGSATLIPSQGWGIVILTNVFPGLIADPIRKLYLGIVNILQGVNPSQSQNNIWNSLLVFGLPVVLLGQIGFLVRSLCRKIQQQMITQRRFWYLRIWFPIVIHSSISLGFLVVLPLLSKVPFSVMLLAQPDVTIAALSCSGVAICSLLRTIFLANWAIGQLAKHAKTLLPR